jgi:hypothetical protein
MTTTTTGSAFWTATLDHRTGATLAGGPASRYQRVARCDGRPSSGGSGRPNYAARRLGALFFALCAVMSGAWLLSQAAAGVAGQPASAAAAVVLEAGQVAPAVHVAQEGDTLWSIADSHRGDVSRERFINALVVLNGGTSIHIGQAVSLP